MDIMMYSTGCPKCKTLERKLAKANVNFCICEELDVIQEIAAETGFDTLPILQVGEKYLTFSDAIAWIKEGGDLD